MLPSCMQIWMYVSLFKGASKEFELSSSGSLGKTFFQWRDPRTLFHKGFGYFKACHQDCPRPIVKFSRCQVEAATLVWAPSRGNHCLWAPRLQGCWQEWAPGPWKVHPSPAVPLTASFLETLWLQLPSLQLYQMPFSPGATTAASDKVHFSLRNSSPSFFYLPPFLIDVWPP